MAFRSDDMYTGGQYCRNNPGWDDKYTEWKAGIIFELLKKNGIHPKTVVEVGCGAGGILQHLSAFDKDIMELKGYDISPHAIELASKKESPRLSFYNDDYISHSHPAADVLLCIDVIEHIDNMYGFLAKLVSRASYTVFHIPLDISCKDILKPDVMLQQRRLSGHIHYFTKEMVEWALQDCGYRIVDWVYTKPVTDWEPAGNFKKRIKKPLRNFSFLLNKDLTAKLWGGYSMMILAT